MNRLARLFAPFPRGGGSLATASRALLMAGLVVLSPAGGAAQVDAGEPRQAGDPLRLDDVLGAVESMYPPLLAALIERDVRDGRLRSARSIYDLDLFGKYKGAADAYYEYDAVEAGLEQFLGLWGTTVYGGYRLTTGETLPDYYNEIRTQADGEVALGLRVPLLQGGAIDPGRAALQQAEIQRRGAEPVIGRQRLDFIRAGSVAYYKWLAAGLKLGLARELLAIANARTAALEEQVSNGIQPDIVLVDNRRLVVSRELAVIDAERDFRGAALALSLFYRDENGEPVTPGEDRLPGDLGLPAVQDIPGEDAGVVSALERRPELARYRLKLEELQVDRNLAGNYLLPSLDASLEASRDFGDELYSDLERDGLSLGLSFKLPVPLRQARGKVEETEAKLSQARQELAFVREKVSADVRKAWTDLDAARRQVDRAELNVELAVTLRDAEQERFRLGSSDLLALQIREQSAFDAQSKQVETYLDFFTALADYRAAIAADLEPPQDAAGGS